MIPKSPCWAQFLCDSVNCYEELMWGLPDAGICECSIHLDLCAKQLQRYWWVSWQHSLVQPICMDIPKLSLLTGHDSGRCSYKFEKLSLSRCRENSFLCFRM